MAHWLNVVFVHQFNNSLPHPKAMWLTIMIKARVSDEGMAGDDA